MEPALHNQEPLFRGIPIFAGLEEQAISILASRALMASHKPGDVIVREGEPGNRLFVIRSGEVRILKGIGTPHPVELAHLEANDFFGEMCILETLPRSASVVAATEVELAGITSLTFYHLFQQMPGQYAILVLNIARDLSRRLRHLDEVYTARC